MYFNVKFSPFLPDYYTKTKMIDLVRKARADKRRHDLQVKSLAEARERQKKDTVSLDDVDEVKEDSSTPAANAPDAQASKIGFYQPVDDAPVVVSDDVMVSDGVAVRLGSYKLHVDYMLH